MTRNDPKLVTSSRASSAKALSRGCLSLGSQDEVTLGSYCVVGFLRGLLTNHDTPLAVLLPGRTQFAPEQDGVSACSPYDSKPPAVCSPLPGRGERRLVGENPAGIPAQPPLGGIIPLSAFPTPGLTRQTSSETRQAG